MGGAKGAGLVLPAMKAEGNGRAKPPCSPPLCKGGQVPLQSTLQLSTRA